MYCFRNTAGPLLYSLVTILHELLSRNAAAWGQVTLRASSHYYVDTGESETKCLLATPAAGLCDCPCNAVGWTFIHGKCTCELPVNLMIESHNKRGTLAENNICLNQIEERSLGCSFYQCDHMRIRLSRTVYAYALLPLALMDRSATFLWKSMCLSETVKFTY